MVKMHVKMVSKKEDFEEIELGHLTAWIMGQEDLLVASRQDCWEKSWYCDC